MGLCGPWARGRSRAVSVSGFRRLAFPQTWYQDGETGSAQAPPKGASLRGDRSSSPHPLLTVRSLPPPLTGIATEPAGLVASGEERWAGLGPSGPCPGLVPPRPSHPSLHRPQPPKSGFPACMRAVRLPCSPSQAPGLRGPVSPALAPSHLCKLGFQAWNRSPGSSLCREGPAV